MKLYEYIGYKKPSKDGEILVESERGITSMTLNNTDLKPSINVLGDVQKQEIQRYKDAFGEEWAYWYEADRILKESRPSFKDGEKEVETDKYSLDNLNSSKLDSTDSNPSSKNKKNMEKWL